MAIRRIVALDLGFTNMGVAIRSTQGSLQVRKVSISDGTGNLSALSIGALFTGTAAPLLDALISDDTHQLVLEKPYMLPGTRTSSIAVPLIVLYNLIYARYAPRLPGGVVGLSPSIKRTLYGFEGKADIVKWASGLCTALPMNVLTPHDANVFFRMPKKDDMADALFMLTHTILTSERRKEFQRAEMQDAAAIAKHLTPVLFHADS